MVLTVLFFDTLDNIFGFKRIGKILAAYGSKLAAAGTP